MANCRLCNGSGSVEIKKERPCPRCGGSGQGNSTGGMCQKCSGLGTVNTTETRTCPRCNGSGED